MDNSANALLQPDFAAAANAEQALTVLHIGDSRVTQADRYLAGVRTSLVAWPVCCAIIRNPDSSHAALMFAANTIHARTRADWLTFADDSHRMTAFNLALEGLCKAKSRTPGMSTSSPVHFFGKTCGFCLNMAQTPNSRDLMWASLNSQIGTDPVLRCNTLAAVIQEIDQTSTTHVETYVIMRSFCQSKAAEVLSAPISILNKIDSCSPANSGNLSVQDMRAGVLCLHAWQKYSEKIPITLVLLKAIRVPQLADDVSETLTEIVGYSGSNVQLLIGTCDGLISAFQATQRSHGECVVHHAIAEVACALSDGNADELMEQESKNSVVLAQKTTQLLSICLKSKDDRAFFASVQGWTSWITAANLVEQSRARVVRDQVASVVYVVVQRMKSLQSIANLIDSDGNGSHEANDEMVCVRDLLLEATKSLGVGEYVKVTMPLFEAQWNASPHACCAALFSLSVAGESDEGVSLHAEDKDIVLRLLGRIMDLVENFIANPGNERTGYASVKTTAMASLCSYAALLSGQGSEAEFHRALRCAGTGMLDGDVGEKATEFLYELADANPRRLTQFVAELISSGTGALPRMSEKAAINYVRSLSKVASALALPEERRKAMDAILANPCEHVLWVCAEQKVAGAEESVRRALGLISAGLQEVNDNETAVGIFAQLRGAVFEIAVSHCAIETVSRAVCRLLEVCVLPTLLDDEQPDEHKQRVDAATTPSSNCGRVVLAMSCMSLAAECFRRSGNDGETVWLSAVAQIAPYVLECLEGGFGTEVEGRALACVSVSLQHALEGLQAFTDGVYDAQSTMAVAYFRFATRLLGGAASAGAVASNGLECAGVGLKGLQCEDISVVREALLWWKSVFGPGLGEVASAVLAGAGGADFVARAFVCAARHTRCAGAVADALFALCKWVAQVSGETDPDNVLRACLTAAFAAEGVPGLSLDARVREMLYRSCMNSTGSMRDFRQALREFGRIYSLALLSK